MMFDKYKKIKTDTPMGSMEGVGVTMPEQKPSDEELKVEGERMQQRTDWWNVPTYTQAVENQRKAAMEAAQKDVNRAKRTRDAALITDMADVFTRMYAQSGNGAWQTPQVQNRAGAANEAYNNALARRDGLVVDFDGKIAQARMQDYLNKKKQQQVDREYELAVAKAKREDEQQAYKERLEFLKLANDQAEFEYRQKKDEEDRKSRDKIAADDRASREKIAKERNESYERTYSYGGRGRNNVLPIDLGDGNFVELDKQKWSAANKPAIAKVVKDAIWAQMPEGNKKTGSLWGTDLHGITGKDNVYDLSQEDLVKLWRQFPTSIMYVKQNYGIDGDKDADYYNQFRSTPSGYDKEYFERFLEE